MCTHSGMSLLTTTCSSLLGLRAPHSCPLHSTAQRAWSAECSGENLRVLRTTPAPNATRLPHTQPAVIPSAASGPGPGLGSSLGRAQHCGAPGLTPGHVWDVMGLQPMVRAARDGQPAREGHVSLPTSGPGTSSRDAPWGLENTVCACRCPRTCVHACMYMCVCTCVCNMYNEHSSHLPGREDHRAGPFLLKSLPSDSRQQGVWSQLGTSSRFFWFFPSLPREVMGADSPGTH